MGVVNRQLTEKRQMAHLSADTTSGSVFKISSKTRRNFPHINPHTLVILTPKAVKGQFLFKKKKNHKPVCKTAPATPNLLT